MESPSYGGIPPANVDAPAATPQPPKSTKLPDTIATPAPKPGLKEELMSFANFFNMVELTPPRNRKVEDAQPALDRAEELGIFGWKYRSSRFKFYRQPITE